MYHAAALAASPRCVRYRYNVQDVRSKLNITVLTGEVYLDGQPLCRFLRLEYRAARLAEAAREQHRVLGDQVQAWIRVQCDAPPLTAEAHLTLHYDPGISSVLRGDLGHAGGSGHELSRFAVLDLMGWRRPITRVRELTPVLRSGRAPGRIEVAFAEPDRTFPTGVPIPDVVWDNNLLASHQEPRTREPSASREYGIRP